MRAFFNWCAAQEQNFRPPRIPLVKAPLEREHDYLTDEEIPLVLSRLEGETRRFVEFLLLTGMRRGEAIASERAWLRDGFIRIPASVSKTDSPRLVPVTAALDRLLQGCPATGRLWPKATENVSRVFRAACIAAGLKRPLKMHNLRDTYIVRAVKAGVPLLLVARITGHDPATLSRHYAHLGEEAYGEARRRLDFATVLLPNSLEPEKYWLNYTLGAEGRWFESSRPDYRKQPLTAVFCFCGGVLTYCFLRPPADSFATGVKKVKKDLTLKVYKPILTVSTKQKPTAKRGTQ